MQANEEASSGGQPACGRVSHITQPVGGVEDTPSSLLGQRESC
jgi:hypothetical protein